MMASSSRLPLPVTLQSTAVARRHPLYNNKNYHLSDLDMLEYEELRRSFCSSGDDESLKLDNNLDISFNSTFTLDLDDFLPETTEVKSTPKTLSRSSTASASISTPALSRSSTFGTPSESRPTTPHSPSPLGPSTPRANVTPIITTTPPSSSPASSPASVTFGQLPTAHGRLPRMQQEPSRSQRRVQVGAYGELSWVEPVRHTHSDRNLSPKERRRHSPLRTQTRGPSRPPSSKPIEPEQHSGNLYQPATHIRDLQSLSNATDEETAEMDRQLAVCMQQLQRDRVIASPLSPLAPARPTRLASITEEATRPPRTTSLRETSERSSLPPRSTSLKSVARPSSSPVPEMPTRRMDAERDAPPTPVDVATPRSLAHQRSNSEGSIATLVDAPPRLPRKSSLLSLTLRRGTRPPLLKVDFGKRSKSFFGHGRSSDLPKTELVITHIPKSPTKHINGSDDSILDSLIRVHTQHGDAASIRSFQTAQSSASLASDQTLDRSSTPSSPSDESGPYTPRSPTPTGDNSMTLPDDLLSPVSDVLVTPTTPKNTAWGGKPQFGQKPRTLGVAF